MRNVVCVGSWGGRVSKEYLLLCCTTADNPVYHMGLWISFWDRYSEGVSFSGYLGFGFCGAAGDAASYLLFIIKGAFTAKAGR